MKIQLTENEFNYFLSQNFFPEKYKGFLKNNIDVNFKLTITEDDADEIREICMDYLPVYGFDSNYELNEQGKILEKLIDKFFIG